MYNRKRLLMQAKTLLLTAPRTRYIGQSHIYETTPVDVKPQYADMERTEDRNAPRPIDIDIIYAGDQVIDSGGLEVPHPRWAERRFVVEPLCDIRPSLVIPEEHKPVSEILRTLPADDGLSVLDEAW
jgi:7,8-dihydro-6-hydroxymethylpterin-pyrophosphokinase